MKHSAIKLLTILVISTAAARPAAAQDSAANNAAHKPGDPVYIDTAKILENNAAQQQQNTAALPQEPLDMAPTPAKEAAPHEMIVQEMQALKFRSDVCLSGNSCSVKDRVQLLRKMSNAMYESSLRFDGVCNLMSYNGCIAAQRTDLQQWYVMNDQMKSLMQTLTPIESRSLLLSANPAAELNSIQPAAGDPMTGAPPTVP